MNLKSVITSLGVKDNECQNLSNDEAIQYLLFHQRKNWSKAGIIFIGFDDNELSELHRIANENNLTIYKSLSSSIKFVCIGQHTNNKRIEKARTYCPVIFSRHEYMYFFGQLRYSLKVCSLLFDDTIPNAFRIAKPLGNFDLDDTIGSFTGIEDKHYKCNLYKMTCTCSEFTDLKKDKYPLGDLRRLCKHQLMLYKERFGIFELSPFACSVLEGGHSLKNQFHFIKIAEVGKPVVVNFEKLNGWWDVYVLYKHGKYNRYSYNSNEKRFAYNEKPIGIVPKLRSELVSLERSLNPTPQIKIKQPPVEKRPIITNPQGCLLFFIGAAFFLWLLLKLTWHIVTLYRLL